MKNLQEVFNNIETRKREQREIKNSYRDALDNSMQYKSVTEELKKLKVKKKEIEDAIKADFTSEFDQLDSIKTDIATDKMLMTDIAITRLMKGEVVEVVDANNSPYEPVFSVNFKKKK